MFYCAKLINLKMVTSIEIQDAIMLAKSISQDEKNKL